MVKNQNGTEKTLKWKMKKPIRLLKRRMNKAKRIVKKPLVSEVELEKQRECTFEKKITYSIMVPLDNTPEQFLRELIESVRHQTYPYFELWLVDKSDKKHKYVREICEMYSWVDRRIRYKRLNKKLGASETKNKCLQLATGEYIGFIAQEDFLNLEALYEVTRAIDDTGADFIYTDESFFRNSVEGTYNPHFKPDFASDTLCGNNYIDHFSVFQRSLLNEVKGFDSAYEGAEDYDFVLRVTEKAKRIAHIPQILYYWRSLSESNESIIGVRPYDIKAGIQAVQNHLERMGLKGEVSTVSPEIPVFRIKYKIYEEPKISILIPNCDHYEDLKKCLDSIYEKSSYKNYEIVIVENNSTESEIFEYYKHLEKEQDNVKVVVWDGHFNYSAINNFGVKNCSGEYLILLNNDTEVISSDWIQEMLMYAQRKDVGIVGAKLYYPDNTIQHAGVGVGISGVAGHFFKGFQRADFGYMGRLLYAQNVSAVTGACLMMRRDVWDEAKGLDEKFEVAFNDIDLCMRVRKAGYHIIWTPYAELYHHESKSRGSDLEPENHKRFLGEIEEFQKRWKKELEVGDPYFNPNFSLNREDFYIKPVAEKYYAR